MIIQLSTDIDSINNLSIESSISSFYSFLHPSIQQFIHSFIHPSIHPSIYLFIHKLSHFKPSTSSYDDPTNPLILHSIFHYHLTKQDDFPAVQRTYTLISQPRKAFNFSSLIDFPRKHH